MLKEFRESFAADLLNPDFQREFIAAAYEEEGPDGVLAALREIAVANQEEASYDAAATIARASAIESSSFWSLYECGSKP